jgi:hypothetical protein
LFVNWTNGKANDLHKLPSVHTTTNHSLPSFPEIAPSGASVRLRVLWRRLMRLGQKNSVTDDKLRIAFGYLIP